MNTRKLNWPAPSAYLLHYAMSEDAVAFRRDKRARRHTPLYTRQQVEDLLEQHRRLLLTATVDWLQAQP